MEELNNQKAVAMSPKEPGEQFLSLQSPVEDGE